jgi:hypothetical protein
MTDKPIKLTSEQERMLRQLDAGVYESRYDESPELYILGQLYEMGLAQQHTLFASTITYSISFAGFQWLQENDNATG